MRILARLATNLDHPCNFPARQTEPYAVGILPEALVDAAFNLTDRSAVIPQGTFELQVSKPMIAKWLGLGCHWPRTGQLIVKRPSPQHTLHFQHQVPMRRPFVRGGAVVVQQHEAGHALQHTRLWWTRYV